MLLCCFKHIGLAVVLASVEMASLGSHADVAVIDEIQACKYCIVL
jgi:hypothetical protein